MDQTLTKAAFTSLLRDWPAQEIIELGNHMRELTAHPAWDALVDFMGHAREQAYRGLENGAPLERAVYAKHTGWLAALSQMREIPGVVIDKAEAVERSLKENEEALSA